MASASEQQEAAGTATSAADTNNTTQPAMTSPARSDKSSDSEGRPVREKFKETRIDAQAVSESEQAMKDAPNGSTKVGDQSASGSESERGRLRRKRSREDFEDETEIEKHAGKKMEGAAGRHARKRSRDISKEDLPPKPAPSKIPSIEENDADEQLTTSNTGKTATAMSEQVVGADTSPKNKRTRDQAESDLEATTEVSNHSANGKPVETTEERNTKRLRDQDEVKSSIEAAEPKTKVRRNDCLHFACQTNCSKDSPRQWLCQHLRGLPVRFHVAQASSIQVNRQSRAIATNF
jgi:Ran-binding protein 3